MVLLFWAFQDERGFGKNGLPLLRVLAFLRRLLFALYLCVE